MHFLPPILIPKVLMKVRQENDLILLVAPLAPHQSWFPQLLELIVDVPLKLSVLHDLLSQNRGLSLHPNPRSLNLAVWSGKYLQIKIFKAVFFKSFQIYETIYQILHRETEFR